MSPDPPSPLRVRPARRDEIPALCRIGREAFRGRPLTEAINPPHLVGEAGDEAVVEFRAARQRRVFDDPEKHFVVVEDAGAGAGEVAGYAIWHAYPVGPVVAAPPPASETAEARAARLAKLPPIVDVAALETLERETVLLDQTIRDALGEEGYENSWCKSELLSFTWEKGVSLISSLALSYLPHVREDVERLRLTVGQILMPSLCTRHTSGGASARC